MPNLGEWKVWNVRALSEYPIFVTAEYIWEGQQAHYSPHRYKINAYTYDKVKYCYVLLTTYDTQQMHDVGDDDRAHFLNMEKRKLVEKIRLVAPKRSSSPAER